MKAPFLQNERLLKLQSTQFYFMSGILHDQDSLWEMGLSHVKKTFVCASHIKDYAITKYIKQNSQKGVCSYCKRSKGIVSFETLMLFIMKGIMNFYEDAAEFMSYDSREGGYQGQTYTQWELINDVIGLNIDNFQLQDDITDCIDDRAWSEPNSYFDSDEDIAVYHWGYFKEVTKYKSRYLFGKSDGFKSDTYNLNAYDILEDIASKVKEFGLTKSLSQNTPLFRCRQHSASTIVSTPKDIVAPPGEKALFSNRMSPAGISMFYCAFKEETATAETVDQTSVDRDYYSTAIFKARRSLNLIDLSDLPRRPSMFDIDNFPNYYSIGFLQDFVKDISQSIKRDGKEHIDYVPTQIVTEYFRYIFKGDSQIDGLIYPSAKLEGEKCCVLFFDHEQSLQELSLVPSSLFTKKKADLI